MIKTLSKVRIKATYLNVIKATYKKPTVNIMLNGQKLKVFPLRSGTRQGCPLSQLLFNIVQAVLATKIRKEEKTKCIQIGNKEVKWSLFADDILMYMKNPRGYTKNRLNLISEFGKVVGYKINIQKPVAFFNTNNELSERETKKNIPFTIATKRK